jgi:natural product precursor
MKLTKINLNQLSDTELNEREMCRLLGGGTPGCCQCGCNYATSGGSGSSSNDSANNANGYTSDPGATTPCDEPSTPETQTHGPDYDEDLILESDNTRVVTNIYCNH